MEKPTSVKVVENEDREKEKSLLEKTQSTVDEMKEQNDRKEELLQKETELKQFNMLGGQSEGGAQPPKEPEISDVEYAKQVMEGKANPLKDDGII